MLSQGGLVVADGYAYGNSAQMLGDDLYVATGTYSLGVQLPAGAVQLDFARSGGDAEIAIWAVPVSMLDSLYKVGLIIAALLIVLGIARIWPRPTQKKAMTWQRLLVYAVATFCMLFFLGLLGLMATILLIAFAETRRGAFVTA